MSEATIIHADLDAFFASVEQRDDPSLRGRPVIVGGGVVLAASYEARAFGIKSAMGGAQARRLCPHVTVVPARFEAYVEASRTVMDILREMSPLVEPLSIDEAFLDVRGLRHILGTPTAIALTLRRRVLEEVGLAITVGLASTKFLAKVASAVAKPDGLLVVPAGSETAFLHPLPVQRLWGVGPVTAARLHAQGLRSVGQVARIEEAVLVELLGRGSGRKLHALARNHDPRPVERRRRRRSIGAQRALGRRPRSRSELDATLVVLIERVSGRMRTGGRACRTVVLRLRFGDFSRATRSHTIPEATTRTSTLLAVARGLLAANSELVAARGLTLLGVSLTNLCRADAIQLALPFDRTAGIDETLDRLRERFGPGAIRRGVLIGRRPDEWAPLLPD